MLTKVRTWERNLKLGNTHFEKTTFEFKQSISQMISWKYLVVLYSFTHKCIEKVKDKTQLVCAKILIGESKWDKVFKNGPSKICGRQPLKNFT